MTSFPARRDAAFRSLMVAKTYGGRPLIRRNSITGAYDPPRHALTPPPPTFPPPVPVPVPPSLARTFTDAAARTFADTRRLPGRGRQRIEVDRPPADGPGGTGTRHRRHGAVEFFVGRRRRAGPGDFHRPGS